MKAGVRANLSNRLTIELEEVIDEANRTVVKPSCSLQC